MTEILPLPISLNADQMVTLKITLAAAILGANLAVAAILFGVLGFVYSVFATFARRDRPQMDVLDETVIDLRAHPIIAPLRKTGRWISITLLFSLIISFVCFLWFFRPSDIILIVSSIGLLGEVLFMVTVGFYIAFKLMPKYV